MKIVISIILSFILVGLSKPKIELHILDESIQSGRPVNIEIINNSKLNYCFVIDTLFNKSNENYYGGLFLNPKIYLKDLKGFDVPIIREIRDHSQKKDTLVIEENNTNRISSSLRFIVVKAGKSLNIKIPFNLVIKFSKNNIHEYYEINMKRKYNGIVSYVIDQNFINRNCSKNQIDSIKKKGYKIFMGSLYSNKVPLIIDK